MTFKDIKTNNTVFILDKNNLKVIPAKVINASQPKIDMSKPNSCMSGTTLIVDIDLACIDESRTHQDYLKDLRVLKDTHAFSGANS